MHFKYQYLRLKITDIVIAITIFESILNILSMLKDVNMLTTFTTLIMFIAVYFCSVD